MSKLFKLLKHSTFKVTRPKNQIKTNQQTNRHEKYHFRGCQSNIGN